MTERPIIFSAPMVRAILDGRKTQTRRVLKPQPVQAAGPFSDVLIGGDRHPYRVGDTLWVREACRAEELPDGRDGVRYEADQAWREIEPTREAADEWLTLLHYGKRRGVRVPSIHMPRWASRITLRVTGVRVERLHDISEQDAIAEGVLVGQLPGCFHSGIGRLDVEWRSTATHAFEHLWESINGPGAWDANPWVAAISFERLHA